MVVCPLTRGESDTAPHSVPLWPKPSLTVAHERRHGTPRRPARGRPQDAQRTPSAATSPGCARRAEARTRAPVRSEARLRAPQRSHCQRQPATRLGGLHNAVLSRWRQGGRCDLAADDSTAPACLSVLRGERAGLAPVAESVERVEDLRYWSLVPGYWGDRESDVDYPSARRHHRGTAARGRPRRSASTSRCRWPRRPTARTTPSRQPRRGTRERLPASRPRATAPSLRRPAGYRASHIATGSDSSADTTTGRPSRSPSPRYATANMRALLSIQGSAPATRHRLHARIGCGRRNGVRSAPAQRRVPRCTPGRHCTFPLTE